MGKIGEFEKTIIAEPLEEPLPDRTPQKISEEPVKGPAKPVKVS